MYSVVSAVQLASCMLLPSAKILILSGVNFVVQCEILCFWCRLVELAILVRECSVKLKPTKG